MTDNAGTRSTDYVTGVSDHPCGEITPEMQAVMDGNSRALAEMMDSPRDGSVSVRYRVVDIDASQKRAPVLRSNEASAPKDGDPAA